MLDKVRKVCYFLRIIDEEPRLDLSDLAFMIILGKIIYAHEVDWPSMVTLAIAALNSMHNRQLDAKANINEVQEMTQKISDIEQKLTPVIDKIKGIV
jgi:hypothetical protein